MAFQKGQSGNPGGRPKEDPEVKELARSYTVQAIERLAYWLNTNDPSASVKAALALLDRAWGKPMQAMELTGKDGGPIQTEEVDENKAARAIAFTLEQAARNTKPTEH